MNMFKSFNVSIGPYMTASGMSSPYEKARHPPEQVLAVRNRHGNPFQKEATDLSKVL